MALDSRRPKHVSTPLLYEPRYKVIKLIRLCVAIQGPIQGQRDLSNSQVQPDQDQEVPPAANHIPHGERRRHRTDRSDYDAEEGGGRSYRESRGAALEGAGRSWKEQRRRQRAHLTPKKKWPSHLTTLCEQQKSFQFLTNACALVSKNSPL